MCLPRRKRERPTPPGGHLQVYVTGAFVRLPPAQLLAFGLTHHSQSLTIRLPCSRILQQYIAHISLHWAAASRVSSSPATCHCLKHRRSPKHPQKGPRATRAPNQTKQFPPIAAVGYPPVSTPDAAVVIALSLTSQGQFVTVQHTRGRAS